MEVLLKNVFEQVNSLHQYLIIKKEKHSFAYLDGMKCHCKYISTDGAVVSVFMTRGSSMENT